MPCKPCIPCRPWMPCVPRAPETVTVALVNEVASVPATSALTVTDRVAMPVIDPSNHWVDGAAAEATRTRVPVAKAPTLFTVNVLVATVPVRVLPVVIPS